MAYDMGQATAKISLDISDVNKKTSEVEKDFEAISKSSDEVVKSIEEQAKAFDKVLGQAYKTMEKSLTPIQRAYQALDTLVEENNRKVQKAAEVAKSAASIQEQAHERVVASYKKVASAQQLIDQLLKEYTEMQQLNQLPNRNFDLVKEEQRYIAALNEKYKLEQQYNEAVKAETAATQQAAQAQQAYQNVLKQTNDINAKAKNDLNTYEAKQAQYNETKLKQTKEIKEVNKQQADERKRQLEEEKQQLQQLEEQQKKAADQQALAFGIAAKAVDEVVEGVKKLTQELINLGKEVLDIGSDFETSMAQVAATSGMTATDVSSRISDYQDLVDAAKQAGLTTIYSASEAGQALNYLALAGYNVEQSIETMPDILTIAAAGAMDLGRASDMVTDAMNALDLEIGTTSDFIDKMAKTAQSSNTNVEQLGNAILTVGGTATVLSGGVTELDTALGLLANSGIKARVGGTALRQILLNLTAPAKQGAEMIEKLGLQVFDAEGNLRPLKDIFTELNDIMADFTDQQRMEALNAIFDKRQIRAANALLQATGEKWDTLEAKISNAEGSAERMAETMRSNLNGALNIAKSNLEAIAITLYEGVSKNITDLVEEAVPKFQELNKALASPEMQSRLENMSESIKEIALNVLDKIIAVAPKIIEFISNLETNLDSLRTIITAVIGINIIAHIMDVIKAVGALAATLVTNPYIALIAGTAAAVVAIQQITAAIENEHKAMVAAIEAENDAWKNQRAEVKGVVDEWNDYKEAAENTAKENETHVESVHGLYEEYKKLYESGQDTTLALEALADEVPEVNKLLDEGTASFEDITKATDDYCESLIKLAEVEANKEMYVQAVKTRAQLQGSIDDLRASMIQSGADAAEAKAKLDSFINTWGDNEFFMSASTQKRYRELKAEYEGLNNIYAENAKSYSEANTAIIEADKAVETAKEGYYTAIKGDLKEEGKIYDSREEAQKAANERYAEQQREYYKSLSESEQAAVTTRAEALADSIDAGIADIERHMSLRDEGYNDQSMIDFYAKMFGSDEDWGRNNERLVKHYDKYMSLQEKKADEIKKKQEQEQKDRDKLAKEAEQKQKEREAEWKKSIEKGLSDIDWLAGYEEWDLQKQSDAYKKYLADNNKFFSTHADERESLERKILEIDKQINQEQTKTGDEAAKKYIETWTSNYDKLIDRATKAYDALEKKRTEFQNNLLKGVKLYTEESTKVWNRFTQQYEDSTGMKVSSKAMKEQLKELQDYDKAIDKLRAKDVSEDLITEVLGMDTEKGLEFANALNNLSTKELKEYQAAYQAVHDKASEMTSDYYSSELEKWKTEYMQPLQEYVQGSQSQLRAAYERLGIDSVQGYLDGLNDKADEAEGTTKQIYANCLQDVKDVLGIHSPSTEFYDVGVNVIEGFLNGVQSKAEMLAGIFRSLGQKAGDAFVNAFKETWDNFVDLITIGGGLTVPTTMVAPAFGTPMLAGNQVVYATTDNTYTSGGLTKEDIVSAVREALPGGNVVLTIDKSEFGKISRDALNSVAENSEMGLNV